MANYYARVRTNYFDVTSYDAFQKVIESVEAGDEVEIITLGKRERDANKGKELYGFMCEAPVHGVKCKAPGEGDDVYYDMGPFYEALQEVVAPGHSVMITEIGWEKMCFLHASVVIITQKDIQHMSLADVAINKARLMLEDDSYDPFTEN